MKYYYVWDLYPYFILYFIFIILLLSNKRIDTGKAKIAFLTLLFFEICRYNVGWDYMSYVDIFNGGEAEIVNSRFEPLSKLFMIIAIKLDFYPMLFILFGLTHLSLLAFTIKKMSKEQVLSWTLYLLIPGFFLWDLSTIRQATATAFIFCSFYFLHQRKYLFYFLLVAIASCFHVSAIYGFTMIFISKLKLSQSLNWCLFIFSFFLGNVVIGMLPHLNILRLNYYLDMDSKATTSILNLFYYAINVVILLHYKKLINIDSMNKIYIQLSNWGVVTFNLFLFEPITSTRLSAFFLIFWILLIPSFVKIYKYKFIVLASFFFVNFSYLLIYLNAYNSRILDKVSYIPYDFWWNHLN